MLREKRRLAIQLRKKGGTYSEIKEVVRVSKSSLSLWLRNYPLTKKRAGLVGLEKKHRQIEKFRNTMRIKREKRLNDTYNNLKPDILPLSKRDLLIAGLFLYLGEGAKQTPGQILVSNTDPHIVKFVLYWYTNVLGIPKKNIKVNLQLYRNMDIKYELTFWSSLLEIPFSNFWKPYIKKSSTQGIDHSGFKHGTCGLYYGNVPLHEKIMASIKIILDKITGPTKIV